MIPRLSGGDVWAQLDAGVQDAIGGFAVEMIVSEVWQQRMAAAIKRDRLDTYTEVPLYVPVCAAVRAAGDELHRMVEAATFGRNHLDLDEPAVAWAVGRVCAQCRRTEADDRSVSWIGAERCSACGPAPAGKGS